MHMWKTFSMEMLFINGEDMCEHHTLRIINNAVEDLFPLGMALAMAHG